MGIREVLTAPRSPWQNAYAERLIGSIRRECLDHVLVFREAGLRQTLKQYFAYYERRRICRSKDAPVGRAVEPPSFGEVIQIPQVGGLLIFTRPTRSTKTSPALG
jgi:putative transposase